MEPWVKSFIFQYGSYWEEQAEKYKQFLNANQNKKILFLALGIGRMTPEFIKNPFINMTYSWENSKLILLNKGEPAAPATIADRTIAMNADILSVLQELVKMKGMEKNV